MKFLSYDVNNNISDKGLKAYHKFFLGENELKETNFNIYDTSLEYPELVQTKYAGEVLERFHEIGLLPGHEDFESFLIASTTTIFNYSEHNTNQFNGHAERLKEYLATKDDNFSSKLEQIVYTMFYIRIESLPMNELKVLLKGINPDDLTFEQKKSLLAMTYNRYIHKSSYDSNIATVDSVVNVKRAKTLLYLFSFFTKEDYKNLSREEKMLFIFSSVSIQAVIKPKKAEYTSDFLYKLASQSAKLLRKEYCKTDDKEIEIYLEEIALLDYKTDFLVLHFESFNTLYLKTLNENAYKRLINNMSYVFSDLKQSIYDEEYLLFRNIFQKDGLIKRSARLYISTDNLKDSEFFFDFMYFYVSSSKSSLYLDVRIDLSNDDVVKIFEKVLNDENVTFKVIKEIFSYAKVLDATKDNGLLFIKMYEKVLSFIDESKVHLLEDVHKKFNTKMIHLMLISEKGGYTKENPIEIKKYKQLLFLLIDYFVELRNPKEFLSLKHFNEKETMFYIFKLKVDYDIEFAKDYSKDELLKFIELKLEAVALFSNELYLETVINLYENLLDLNREDVSDIERELYKLMEEVKFDIEKEELSASNQVINKLNKYFIQTEDEAKEFVRNMDIFNFSYTISKSDINKLNKSLRMLGDYINQETIFELFMNQYNIQLKDTLNSARDMNKIGVILEFNKFLSDKVYLFKNNEEKVNRLIKEKLNNYLPVFTDNLIFDFIVKQKENEVVTEDVQV